MGNHIRLSRIKGPMMKSFFLTPDLVVISSFNVFAFDRPVAACGLSPRESTELAARHTQAKDDVRTCSARDCRSLSTLHVE